MCKIIKSNILKEVFPEIKIFFFIQDLPLSFEGIFFYKIMKRILYKEDKEFKKILGLTIKN